MALALSSPWWLWKMATTDKYREGLAERLGRVPARLGSTRDTRPVIWMHAVSVGEVIAISRLVSELRQRAVGHRVMVSSTTRTGQRIARERFGAENVFYYPFDFAFAVRSYLRAFQPVLFVLAETEFWPRMLCECRRAKVPVAVVNARISDRSFPRYLRLRFLWRKILPALTVVLAQSEEDTARLRAIGVTADRVKRGGNLKYDVRATSNSGAAAILLAALPAGAKLLVCGSTLAGEEEILIDAWPQLVAAQPALRMVLAPRHPERFAAVADLLARSSIPWQRRSHWAPDAASGTPVAFEPGSILLLDSMGELASVYSLATMAFIGGSLVAAGGHNPLEPAQFAVPIVMGPHYENFREIVEKLRSNGAIRITASATLTETVAELLQDEIAAHTIGVRAQSVFNAEAGATAKAVDALLALLPRERA